MNKLKTYNSKRTSPEKGFFSKLTKTYSNVVSSKIRKSVSPPSTILRRSHQKHIISDSYNMNGKYSDDHRVEIGAPILISKTNVDFDGLNNCEQLVSVPSKDRCSNESENDIFDDAVSSFSPNFPDEKFKSPQNKHKLSEPNCDDDDDDDEICTNNNNTYFSGLKLNYTEKKLEIKLKQESFELPFENNDEISKNTKNQKMYKSEINANFENESQPNYNLQYTKSNLENCLDLSKHCDSIETDNNNGDYLDEFVSLPSSPIYNSNIHPITNISLIAKCSFSELSSDNDDDNQDDDDDDDNGGGLLSESIIFVQPTECEASVSKVAAEQHSCNNDSYYKSPTELKPISNINISSNSMKSIEIKSPKPIPPPLPPIDIDDDNRNMYDNNNTNIDKQPSLSSLNHQNTLNKKLRYASKASRSLSIEKTDSSINHFNSTESLQNNSKSKSLQQTLNSNNNDNNSNNNNISNKKSKSVFDIKNGDQIIWSRNIQENFDSNDSLDDFDLKSVSLQSLNANNVFLSIEELNEITKEINESEEFNNEIDLEEYCNHRDNLSPSERRITLLKNKNTNLLNLHHNKKKFNHAWNGLKQWIGEEKDKFKEVVHKHAAMQRVGASQDLTTNFKLYHEQNSSRATSIERNHTGHISSNAVSLMSIEQNGSRTPTIINEDLINAITDDSESVLTLTGSGEREMPPIINNSKKFLKSKVLLEGQNGFDELRKYIKQGGDFGKDLINILQERVDAEQIYSKSLSKMSSKLNKACRDVPGIITDTWRGVATEMESRSEVHRQLSTSLYDEIVKPLKALLETHQKTRKTVEANVDKTSRILSEWRMSESKAKKSSHTAARENEKLQDATLDIRIQKSPSIGFMQQYNPKDKNIIDKEVKNAEKDCAKLDNKRRKAEEAVKRADIEYYTLCLKTERARVDWELSVIHGSTVLQNLEMQRLSSMKKFVNNYEKLTCDIQLILEQICQRLSTQVEGYNIQKDLSVVQNIRKSFERPSEQLLPDFYCEHTTLAMNRERRKHALVKLLQLIKSDLVRERKSRNTLKKLSQAIGNQDNQNFTDKLYQIRSMLIYLEGSKCKLQSALLELDHKPHETHLLTPHIQITRDRTGLQKSILKVPLWLKNYNSVSTCEEQTTNTLNDIDMKNYGVQNFNRSKSAADIPLNGTFLTTLNNRQNSINGLNNDKDSSKFDCGINDSDPNHLDSDFDEFSSQEPDDNESRHSIDDDLTCIDVAANDVGISNISNNNSNDSSNNNHSDNINDNNSINNKNNDNNNNKIKKTVAISMCKALYNYTPSMDDELELTPGDIIEVHIKQDDGWWLGALGDRIGIFPATYVEEIV